MTNMQRMFRRATAFNQPLGKWNMSSVTDMYGMLSIGFFNHDISSWDVSRVTDMDGVFQNAIEFNQPLASWDVSKVERMFVMFENAAKFNVCRPAIVT